ncbi:hypothetical protein [Bacillus subtilis]|uniref:hypothetical protein n=1 Tax=Bacillus subtilis TaxID=1423 RepID=UPI00164A311D|nr:hypothetical protein [Bacillus subtilis]QNK37092.1 hypothetical protein H8S71_01495 [Bacillus subtilis subsp. subtilis]
MRAEEQSKIREAAAGTIFLLIGTVCFASKSIWIKWAYQMGAEPDAVLLYRQLLAVPRAAAISMAGPILTIFYGALFLGERLRLIQVIGYTAVFFVITGMEYRKLKTGKKE